jgi:hypothetical protein
MVDLPPGEVSDDGNFSFVPNACGEEEKAEVPAEDARICGAFEIVHDEGDTSLGAGNA